MRTSIAPMALAMVLATVLSVTAGSAAAQVAGNTYTSPSYGYTVSWPVNWFFLDESTEQGLDFLQLSDGLSGAQFIGGPAAGTPDQELAGVIVSYGGQPGLSNFTPMLDDAGSPVRYGDANLAYAEYSFSYEDSGVAFDGIVHLEVRTVSLGISVAIVLDTGADELQANPATFDGLTVNGEPLGFAESGDQADIQAGPDEALAVEGGAQSFANGQWRIAMATVVTGAELPSLALEPKPDRDWVVIIADVTNWSSTNGTFSLRDPLVRTAEMTEAWDIAPSSTRQVARQLGLTDQGNESVDIAADVTTRIVLVYSIPAMGTDLKLLVGPESLPLDALLSMDADPALLPPSAPAPQTQSASITNVSVTSAGEVTLGFDTSTESFVLIGSDLPSGSDCHANESLAVIAQHIGSNALIERDPALANPSEVYVWITNADGTRSLMNHQLIASGDARLATIPNAAVFAGWLQETEQTSQETPAGLWVTC